MGSERGLRRLAILQKAFLGPYVNGHMELKGRFYVPFNPAELSVEEAVGAEDVSRVNGGTKKKQWEQGNNSGVQYPEEGSSRWRSRGMTRLSVTLFFNTLNDLYQSSYEDVREEIRKLYPYTNTTEIIQKASKASGSGRGRGAAGGGKARQIYFFWGSIAIAGMLTQMSVTYTMFAPDGRPVRAQVSIAIEGFYVGEEAAGGAGKGRGAGADGKAAGIGGAEGGSRLREGYVEGKNPRFELVEGRTRFGKGER